MMWPFGRKRETSEPSNPPAERDPKLVTIHHDDDSMVRARHVVSAAGIGINDTMYSLLPWMALVLEKYKVLDMEAGAEIERSKRKRRTKV